LLREYPDLLRFAEQAGLLDATHAEVLAHTGATLRTRALAAAIELREALAALFYGTVDGTRLPAIQTLRTLESAFLAAAQHREFKWQPSPAGEFTGEAHWEWGRFNDDPHLPVWILAQSADRLMTSPALAHVRVCKSETCRWLFLDTSKNHSRRWCDMKLCGNRTKARRFHARHG
jgi:predicted RNA-binding Zn ribbon-like protein